MTYNEHAQECKVCDYARDLTRGKDRELDFIFGGPVRPIYDDSCEQGKQILEAFWNSLAPSSGN